MRCNSFHIVCRDVMRALACVMCASFPSIVGAYARIPIECAFRMRYALIPLRHLRFFRVRYASRLQVKPYDFPTAAHQSSRPCAKWADIKHSKAGLMSIILEIYVVLIMRIRYSTVPIVNTANLWSPSPLATPMPINSRWKTCGKSKL